MNLRRLLLLEVVVGLFVSSSHLTAQSSQSVALAWDASASAEVTGYTVRYGTTSGVYSSATNVGNQTSTSVAGLQAGQTYYLAVTARDAAGVESLPSNETSYQVPAGIVPVITLTAPGANANFAAPATINCAASVTANGYTITKVQFFNGSALLGEDSSSPYSFTWNSVGAGAYSVTARATYDSGSTVTSSAASIAVTNPPAVNGLTFESSAGVITAPFTINGGTISQAVDTGLTSGGRAVYSFNVVNPGDYTISANADAADGAQNSFFVNIDGEPTDPFMIWHIPPTSGLQSRSVSWQGNGTVDSSEFAPKVFNLAAGAHQLIIRGREANVKLGNISLAPVAPTTPTTPPSITLTAPAAGASYTSPATVDLAASVTANGHAITKVQFFNGGALLGEDTSSPYTFAWNNVSAGTYLLKARAVYDSGSTVDSASSTITVTALPAPWQTVDIGTVGLAGSASQSNNIYTVSGAGQISGTADSFRFVYQPLGGNGEIKVRLDSVPTNTVNCKYGVMIRENLSAGSRYAFMGVSQNLKFRWQRRSNTGGSTSTTTATVAAPPYAWVRLVRSGSTITGYESGNGTNWTKVSSRNISMTANVYAGFAVASGSTNLLNTARFADEFVAP